MTPIPTPAQIANARIFAGLTQAQLARAVGCSLDCVRHWEQGSRRPAGLYLRALARTMRKLARESHDRR